MERVAFITGAGSWSGMGAGIASEFDKSRVGLALSDIDSAGLGKVASYLRERGFTVFSAPCDITDAAAVQDVVSGAREYFGKSPDILVNAAGIVDSTPIWDVDEARFRGMMDLNVVGAFNCAKALIPEMQNLRFGRMIFISSMASKAGGGSFGKAHYAASKAAVNGLTQGMARELGPWGITCNAIAPSIVDTGIIAKAVGSDAEVEVLRGAAEGIPVGRVGTAEDVARSVVFLADDKSGFITGEVLDLNGGAYFS